MRMVDAATTETRKNQAYSFGFKLLFLNHQPEGDPGSAASLRSLCPERSEWGAAAACQRISRLILLPEAFSSQGSEATSSASSFSSIALSLRIAFLPGS